MTHATEEDSYRIETILAKKIKSVNFILLSLTLRVTSFLTLAPQNQWCFGIPTQHIKNKNANRWYKNEPENNMLSKQDYIMKIYPIEA